MRSLLSRTRVPKGRLDLIGGRPSPWMAVQEKSVRTTVALSMRVRLSPHATAPSLRGATQRFGGIKLGNASYECSDCEYRRGCSGPAERERAAKYRYASAFMIENLMARDAGEGLKAFIDKREPKWEDR